MSHVVQYSTKEAWLADRVNWIGASEAAAILGLSPWASPLSVYARKLGLGLTEETEPMEWGARLEPAIAQAYAEKTGRAVEHNDSFTTHAHPEHDFIRATLDGTTYSLPSTTTPTPLGHGVLEIKTASAWGKEDWTEEIPLYYQVQVQHQLAVTGRSWGSVGALIGGQFFRWGDVQRHDEFINTVLMPALCAFWRLVEERTPPLADDSAASAAALNVLYSEAGEGPITLGSEYLSLDEERQMLGSRIKEMEKRRLGLTNKLKQAVGNHSTANLPNGIVYRKSVVGPTEYLVKRDGYTTLRRSKFKGER